ncbi:hypothetical protein JYT44_01015 [Caldithrix abyssi]|nr:hypothetical protein [Caldithrix abyssi]
MFKEIFLFELKFLMKKRVMPYLFFLVMFSLYFFVRMVGILESIDNVYINSPFEIIKELSYVSILGLFIILPIIATSVLRDFETNTYATFFTTPISKTGYLFGRLTGGFVVAMFCFSGPVFGMMFGNLLPIFDAESVGPFMLLPYVFTWFIFIVPNILITGAIFFAFSTFSRNMLYTYVAVIIFFVGWTLGGQLLNELTTQKLAGLVDPFGLRAFSFFTQHWTAVEKNTMVFPLDGTLLLNRLIWIGVAVVSLGLTAWKFQLKEVIKKSGKEKRTLGTDESVIESVTKITKQPILSLNFSKAAYLKQLLNSTYQEFLVIIKSVPFMIMAALGLSIIIVNVLDSELITGTPTHWVTGFMVLNIFFSLFPFLIIVLTLYGGELIWRDRQNRVNEYFDAFPVPDWISFTSKLLSLMGVIIFMQILGMVLGITMQMYSGFFDIEFGLYIKYLFLTVGLNVSIIAFLILFIHVMVNNKYLGHMIVVLCVLFFAIALPYLGYNHNLYKFCYPIFLPYSDMNQFGHFLTSFLWFKLYWFWLALVLAVIATLFFVRGTDSGYKYRIKEAKRRRSRSNQLLAACAFVAFILTGGFIFYNTNVLNTYTTRDDSENGQVKYEKTYKIYEDTPQPRIVDVYTEVDFYPTQRDVDIRGRYIIVNKTDSPIDSVHIRINHAQNVKQTINNFNLGDSEKVLDDNELQHYIYQLKHPMQPGDSLDLDFDISYKTVGFLNRGSTIEILYNGSFINNRQYFPHIGYSPRFELDNANDRRNLNLPPRKRMPAIDDTVARQNIYLLNDADWVNYETIISTSPDQIALSPGYLQREWQENGRRYFHYKMDRPILNYYSYQSARYEVVKEKWQGIDLEIYYHKTHTYNLDKMFKSMKKSIAYFSENFSPYQHEQMRILEFPGYRTFAQSFPNTVPYSENAGFIANLTDDKDIDYVFRVTAHEVAHQWWAHQVIGANVQGARLMAETMAQYSALMVMEKEYGKEKMRKFLKYELDKYLRGRSREQKGELPLLYSEDQPYIHYRKGSLVMYALRDYIGEEKLNGALKRYIKKVAYQQAPFTTSLEFLSYIREVTPDSLNYIIEDWFENITLYDNRASDIVYSETENGKYKVELNIKSRKMRADGLGQETEIALADWIEIGVLGEDGKELYLQKHKLTKKETHIEVIVDELPIEAGIDPYNKLIDRNPNDNVTRVVKKDS